MEEGTQRAGEYSNNGGIYFHTYACKQCNEGGRGQDTSKKTYSRYLLITYMHLQQFYLWTPEGATDFHEKTPESKGRTGPVSL